ncbi:DUF2314 domain-containing protein, partial [Bacillus paranthracis]|nr:DUF2314 domain-containing protein [Bacillus paranthracis]
KIWFINEYSLNKVFRNMLHFKHMWFEMQHITEDFIQGILINEPYFIEDMSEGNSYHLDFDDLTEWVIYAGDAVIKPNNLYMFIGE